jgi:hypothetical protein
MKAQSSIKRKPDVAETEPPFGCNVYRTDGDVRVITIHYTADPDKKDPAWRMKNMGSMSPAEWNREMELDEETIAGEVVYPEFVPTKHGHPHIADVMKRRRPQDINASTLWIAGVDAGNTQHPAAVLLEITPTGQIIAIAEVPPPMGASGYTMAQFAPLMQRTWQKKIPSRFTEIDYWADMTVNHHMGGESVAVIAKRLAGIVFHAMSNAPEARHAAVIWALTDTLPGDDEAPRFLVDKEACPFLYEALSGGYCYALPGRSDDTNAQAKPVKNRYADIADALQYGLMRCQQIIRTYEARMFVGGATMDSIWQSIKDPQMQQTTPPKRRDYRRRRM